MNLSINNSSLITLSHTTSLLPPSQVTPNVNVEHGTTSLQLTPTYTGGNTFTVAVPPGIGNGYQLIVSLPGFPNSRTTILSYGYVVHKYIVIQRTILLYESSTDSFSFVVPVPTACLILPPLILPLSHASSLCIGLLL